MAHIAQVIPHAEAPSNSWSEAIVAGWYDRGDGDWLYSLKDEVPPGRQINRAFLVRCTEELKPRLLLVDGAEVTAYSWHETTMMMHCYRAMHRNGSLLPANFAFGVLCDAMTTADVAAAEKELAQ